MAHRKKVSRGTREAVYVRDGWACRYCGLTFDPGRRWTTKTGAAPLIYGPPDYDYLWLEIDHIHPIRHGGGNEIDNLCAACTLCNKKKHDKAAPGKVV